MFKLSGVLLGAALVAMSAWAPAVRGEDWSFPPRVEASDGGNGLMLSGSASLQRNFVPFYSGALYAPLSVRSVDQLLSGMSPCRIRLIWALPELDKSAVQEYWSKALQAAAGTENFPRVKGQVERLVQSLPAAKRGQNVIFDYVPDAGMRVLVDDQPVAQLAGVEFNRTLLGVWIGPSAPKDFRSSLIAGLGKK